jgi:lipoprotein-anchoring transpeptidase ErfK/SrfK
MSSARFNRPARLSTIRGERAGTITIDTKNRYLYLSMAGGRAMRYDVGVGREGFAWSGRAHIGRRAEWPSWTPPAAMLLRRPDLPHVMEGGLANPLGAVARSLPAASASSMRTSWIFTRGSRSARRSSCSDRSLVV